jgi:predicted nucleic acid-binding protein
VILVDTSAWIEYDRGTESDTHLTLRALIAAGDPDLAVTEPVLMEVLAGASDEERRTDLQRLLDSFGWIRFDPAADFTGAAKLYRACRASGVTPRSLIDCMIANIALRTGSELLAADRDFHEMTKVVPLRLV